MRLETAHLLRVGLFVSHGHRLEGVGLRQRHPWTCIGVYTQSDGSQLWLDLEHAMRTSPFWTISSDFKHYRLNGTCGRLHALGTHPISAS